ncbi:MAG: tyrosinase family protein, partial [Dinghuibacter sp.]|nr:tyrosinase family protein [Dinghuibacter sp.]
MKTKNYCWRAFLLPVFVWLLCSTGRLHAQRASVNTYADTSTLACNIKYLLDNYHDELIHDHALDVVATGFDTVYIHNASNFLPWHRYYIHKMENLLHAKYYYSSAEMFPLYYWSPFNRIPDPFFNTNTDGTALCDRANDIPAPDPHADTYAPLEYQDITSGGSSASFTTNLGNIWGSQSAKDFFTNLYGSNSALCEYNTYRHLAMYLGPGPGPHGSVHVAIGGTLGGDFHEAPAASLFSVWHGYIDKVWHDWECDCGSISGADLYIPDSEDDDDLTFTRKRDFTDATLDSLDASGNLVTHNGIDIGMEPNEAPADYPMWKSDDIWVRNTNDGIQNQQHQNPVYTGSPVYVYVRVRNRGCAASSGNEQLKLYWANASTSLDWPNDWSGATSVCSKPSGGQIGTTSIASLAEEGSRIYTFSWTPPNPADYTCVGPNTHFCLLARITDATLPNDGMRYAETTNVQENTRNNNNIAWRNVTVDDEATTGGGSDGDHSVLVRPATLTLTDKLKTGLRFSVPYEVSANRDNTGILNFADVTIRLNANLYNAWLAGNKAGSGVQDIGGRTIRILNKDAYIGNLDLKAGTLYYVTAIFRNKGLPVPP